MHLELKFTLIYSHKKYLKHTDSVIMLPFHFKIYEQAEFLYLVNQFFTFCNIIKSLSNFLALSSVLFHTGTSDSTPINSLLPSALYRVQLGIFKINFVFGKIYSTPPSTKPPPAP